MRASRTAGLGEEKPYETEAPHSRTDHPQAAHCWAVAQPGPKRRRCLSCPGGFIPDLSPLAAAVRRDESNRGQTLQGAGAVKRTPQAAPG